MPCKPCAVCGAARVSVISDRSDGRDPSPNLTDSSLVGSSRRSVGSVRLAQCKVCGLAWQDVMPAPDILRRCYTELQDPYYVAEESGRRRALRGCLRLLSRQPGHRTGRMLDVGCSTGLFLELAQAAGWSVYGIEPSSWLADQARARLGDCISSMTFEDTPLVEGSFDAVTFWDVLEHMPEPSAAVARAARMLRANGLLAISVPNIKSVFARTMGFRWPLLLPEHLYYFSPSSLHLLLQHNGFVTLGLYRHWVYFRLRYVLHRLAQHGFGAARVVQELIRKWSWMDREVPMLMGEVIAVAAKQAEC